MMLRGFLTGGGTRTPNNEKKDAHHGTYMKFASSRFAALIELPACRQAGAHLYHRSGTNFFAQDVMRHAKRD